MPSFSFVLTETCNWNCPYCYFTNIKQKEPKLETFKKHLPYIKKIIDKLDDLVVNIDIQGGEIGLIDIELLEYFFTTMGRKIAVSTNGVFLNKKMHLNEKIRPYIGLIMWHVSQKMDVHIEDIIVQDINISRGIVHDNIDEMVGFIKTNNHIMFDYIELEFDIKYPRKINFIMYHELLNKIEKLDNVTINAKEILYKRLSENKNHRDNCMNYNHSILIDMVNENICLCQRQLDVFIPLTEENLIYRLKTFPKNLWMDLMIGVGINKSCDSCTRLYAGKFYGNVIERALLTRRKL